MKREFKNLTLNDLEKLVGKEQLHRLFLEYYLTLAGQNHLETKIDKLSLGDIME